MGLHQNESVSPQNESQNNQDEAGPASQIAFVNVGKQLWTGWRKPRMTTPTHQRQERDEDSGGPEDKKTQQGSLAGQHNLIPWGLVDAQVTVQSGQK